MIINTMGWIEGLGYNLLLHAIKALKADVIMVVGQDRLHSQLKSEFRFPFDYFPTMYMLASFSMQKIVYILPGVSPFGWQFNSLEFDAMRGSFRKIDLSVAMGQLSGLSLHELGSNDILHLFL